MLACWMLKDGEMADYRQLVPQQFGMLRGLAGGRRTSPPRSAIHMNAEKAGLLPPKLGAWPRVVFSTLVAFHLFLKP